MKRVKPSVFQLNRNKLWLNLPVSLWVVGCYVWAVNALEFLQSNHQSVFKLFPHIMMQLVWEAELESLQICSLWSRPEHISWKGVPRAWWRKPGGTPCPGLIQRAMSSQPVYPACPGSLLADTCHWQWIQRPCYTAISYKAHWLWLVLGG